MDIVYTLVALQQAVIKRLKSHDWGHEMSDKHSAWRKGQADMKEIEEMLSLFMFDRACCLYGEYSSCSDPYDKLRHEQAKKRVEIKLVDKTFQLKVG